MSLAVIPKHAWPVRRLCAELLLWITIPMLGLGYQVTSKFAANELNSHTTLDVAWVAAAVHMPVFWGAGVFEIAGLCAWILVLSEFSLGEAFSISALSYVLVIAASWLIFHEPPTFLQVIGGISILIGVGLIAKNSEPCGPRPY